MHTAADSMYRVYVLGLVGMRCKRAADEDGDGQHTGRVYRDAVGATCADAGMHLDTSDNASAAIIRCDASADG